LPRGALIRIRETDLGPHPEAFALNAAFRKDLPILKVRVEVDWEPRAPAAAVASVEAGLFEVCPGLRDHQCRGDEAYHVLRSTDGEHGRRAEAAEAIEAPLALAHLFEHVVIDAISFITGEPVISGATAALAGSLHEFDVFVESPDADVAGLTVGLARSWLVTLSRGRGRDGERRTTLELCRQLYRAHPEPVDLDAAARELGRGADEVRSGLEWLVRHDLARPVRFTINFSGVSYYGLARDRSPQLPSTSSRPATSSGR